MEQVFGSDSSTKSRFSQYVFNAGFSLYAAAEQLEISSKLPNLEGVHLLVSNVPAHTVSHGINVN